MATKSLFRSRGRLETSRFLPYLLIAPAALLVAAVMFYPIARGVYLGFTEYSLTTFALPRFIGLQNYIEIFLRDTIFRQAVKNTVIWTVLDVGARFLIGFVFALMLNERFFGRRLFRVLILLPWAMPPVAAGTVWRWMYTQDYGVVSVLLAKLGLVPASISWLGDPKLALYSVIAVSIWRGVPFVTIMLLAGLQGIPADLYDAARIDGAGSRACFFHITLPLLKSVIATALILTTIWTFGSFDLTWVMTKGGPAYSSHLLSTYVYQTSFGFFDLGYASALGSLMLVVMIIFAAIYLRRVKL